MNWFLIILIGLGVVILLDVIWCGIWLYRFERSAEGQQYMADQDRRRSKRSAFFNY